MKLISKIEQDKLKNLEAFKFHFKEIEIYRAVYSGKYRYFVFQNPNEEKNNWKYVAENIYELNGWLYGAVQAVCTLEKKDKKEI